MPSIKTLMLTFLYSRLNKKESKGTTQLCNLVCHKVGTLKSIIGEFYFIKEDFICGNFPKESEELHPFFMGHYTGPLVVSKENMQWLLQGSN